MTLEPLLHAPLAVQIHVATIVPAIVIGGWQIFWSRKGAAGHRLLGAAYLALMTVTAVAALFIRAPIPGIERLTGPFGFTPIHVLALWALYGVGRSLYAARTHDVKAHRAAMLGLYFGAIGIAGALAVLLPGRVMNQMLLGL
jgi:uncharacterized membrane protein